MKKTLKILSIILLILIIYIAFDIKFGWHIEISKKIEIDIPLIAKLERKDTHSGFHMDGETLIKVYLTDKQTEKVVSQINENKHWREFPMTDRAVESAIGRVYDDEMEIPMTTIQNGYWFYLDRHSESDNRYDENERFDEKRASRNYTIAVLDTDSNILYYYKLDT